MSTSEQPNEGGQAMVGEVRYLKVNPIRELLRAGRIVGIGARRMTHEALCRLADDAARSES